MEKTIQIIQTLKISVRPHRGSNNRERWAKTRLHIWPNQETALENLVNRRNRPTDVWSQTVVPQVLLWLGVDLTKVTWRWNQKAGCSCGCSPAFVIDGSLPDDLRSVAISVSLDEQVHNEELVPTEPPIPVTPTNAV